MLSFDDDESELHQANSGAIRFQVKCTSGCAQLALCSISPPHRELFKIVLAHMSSIQNTKHGNNGHQPVITDFIDFTMQYQEFWITWFAGKIAVGYADQTNPFMSHCYVRDKDEMIGYIKFNKRQFNPHTRTEHFTEWIYEEPPIVLSPTKLKKLNSGKLRWVSVNTQVNHQLPADALIGGFEKEPLYIARAEHNGSLCPGKYVASQRKAYVPWGRREHIKTQFEILCGYNAMWEKTEGDRIPQNAFIAGMSEVRRDPLYIGRAVHDGCLINGKVHVIYGTCYLPYYGKEIEVGTYEILVVPEVNYRGVLADVSFNISLSSQCHRIMNYT